MVQTVISDGSYDRVSRSMLIAAVEKAGALEQARERADEYAEAARDCLDDLPESEHCEALRAIPAYVLERDR